MPTCFGLVLVLVACVLVSRPVAAAEFTVIPSVALGTRYNDNIDFVEEDKRADLSVVFSPGLRLRQRVERGDINVNGKIYSYSYVDQQELDSIDSEVSADGTYALSQVLTVNASGLHKVDYQSDRDITSSGLVSTNSKRVQNRESLGLDWALSEKTTIGTLVTLGTIEYEDEDFSDNEMQNYDFKITTNLSKFVPELTGLMNLSHSRYDYEFSHSNYTSASFGIGKNLSEKYSVFAWAGPSLIQTEFESDLYQQTDEWGATAHFSLDGRFAQSTTNLSFTYTLEPDSYSSTSVKRTAVKGGFFRQMSSNLRLGVTASYFHNESAGDENSLSTTIDEDTFNISPSLLYQFTDDLGVEANYLFSRIVNDDSDGSRTQNSLFIQLIWSHTFGENDFSYLL